MQFWALGGEATLNLTTSGGKAKVEFNCSLGQPGAPHFLPHVPATSFPRPPPRRPRHRGPGERERNNQRAARHQAAKAAAALSASSNASCTSATDSVTAAVISSPTITAPVNSPNLLSPTEETLSKCEMCDFTSTSRHGLSVHMGRTHKGTKKTELIRDNSDQLHQSLNLSELNETRSSYEPLANSTINTSENVKIEEDKSVQTDNSLDLLLEGEIGKDCEEELIGETFWKIPNDYYFDSWHTHSVRSVPVNGCMVGMTGKLIELK